MKKFLISLFALIMFFSLTGCSNSTTSNNGNEYIKVLGVYYNEDGKIENPKDGVTRNWINIVYEIDNRTDENWEDPFYFGDGVNVLTINSNDYNYHDNTNYLAETYGFSAPGKDKEVWAGAKSIYIANFVVNQADIKEDMSGKFVVKYNDMESVYEFKYDDLTPYTQESLKEISNTK